MSNKRFEKLAVRGITVYRFYQNSRDAVDEYLTVVDPDIQAHMDSSFADKPMLYIIDVSLSGMFSVNYMRQRVAELSKPKEKLPTSYIAYVSDKTNDKVLVNMIDAITRRELAHTRKVFKTEYFDQAIEWLLEIHNQHYNDV